MEIKRGDIYYVSVEQKDYDEKGKVRPVVIVSNNYCNHFSSVIEVVYLTTQPKKPMPTHCYIKAEKSSIALCEQIHSVSKTRLLSYIRSCTELEMQNINACLKISLGIEE